MIDAVSQLYLCEKRTNRDVKYHTTTAENDSTLVWMLFHIHCGTWWKVENRRGNGKGTDKQTEGGCVEGGSQSLCKIKVEIDETEKGGDTS